MLPLPLFLHTPSCLTAGQCVDICQRPDIKAVVEESQRRYKPCSSSDACARGEECTLPQFPCSLVQCNPHAISRGMDFVEFVACPKICLPEAPKMVNASFSDEGDRITVGHNFTMALAVTLHSMSGAEPPRPVAQALFSERSRTGMIPGWTSDARQWHS